MYAGKLVEVALVRDLFREPLHPYTQLLIASLPSLEGKGRLQAIAGLPPSLLNPPRGCPFHPRCPHVMDRCKVVMPPLREIQPRPPGRLPSLRGVMTALLEARQVSKVFAAGLVQQDGDRRPAGLLIRDQRRAALDHRHRRRKRQRQDDPGPAPAGVDRADHRRGALPRQGPAAALTARSAGRTCATCRRSFRTRSRSSTRSTRSITSSRCRSGTSGSPRHARSGER